MYYNFILQIAILLLANKINLNLALNLKYHKNDQELTDLSKFIRNLNKNNKLSQYNGQYETHIIQDNKNKENNKDSKDNIDNNNDNNNGKLSRVQLLFGSSGLELLNKSNVLILGVNKLSSKIITHLIRSGIGSITIWDENESNVKNMLKEILLLNPDANIKVLHTDPVTHLEENEYSTVIFSNQPLSMAYKLNDNFHRKCNFIYSSVTGTYGVVLNDFGKHKVTIPSDDSYPEYPCNVVHSGNETCLEVRTGSKSLEFQKNDTVEVKYRDRTKEGTFYKIKTDKFKIINLVKSKKNVIKIWISTKDNKINKDIISVRKVDEEIVMNFNKLETLIKYLFNLNWFERLIRSILKKDNKNERLVLSPSSGNILNEKSLSVLSCFLTMSKINLFKLDKESELDVYNFYNISKTIYPNTDYNVVSNFNSLKRVNIPAVNSLVGALTAQEAIKSITHLFTPSELIVVDRSDLFTEESGNVDPEKVKNSVDRVSKLSFLLIGSGALGCDYLKLLAEMGVKDVTVVDNDTVDVSNLSRQTLFTINDIGKPKAQSALRNLSLVHNTKGYKHYSMLFSEKSFDLLDLKLKENKNLVAISAMDNIEGRVALDNFCVQNNIPLVESGIYGMKCSTSFTFPRITESFSSSMGDQALSEERYSCSVKGIPSNIDDCIFYSIELFSWIFNTQHMIFNNFIKDPIKSVQLALNTGSDYFYNLIQIVYENLEILNTEDDNKIENRLKIWANRTYDKYIGYESEFKDLLISNLVKLKSMSLKRSGSKGNGNTGDYTTSTQSGSKENSKSSGYSGFSGYPSFDYYKFRSLLNQGFGFEFESHDKNMLNSKVVSKNTFLKVTDEFINKCKNYNNSTNSNNNSNSSNTDEKCKLLYQLEPLVIQEDCNNCTDFIFLVSNFRAKRFNILESDKTSLVQKARNIVPAVSTCVSVATSLSLMELYKLHLVDKSKTNENSFIKEFKNNHSKHLIMRNNELVASDNVVLNDKVNLLYSVYESQIKFYNGNKLILSLETFDYEKYKHLSNTFNNYFFNTSTLKFTTNITDPPKIFKIENEKSILNGISLSYWDYLLIKEPKLNLLKKTVSNKTKYKWKTLFSFSKKTNDYIYLYELVDILEYIFDIKLDALTFQDGYVLVNDSNKNKLLKDLINYQSGDLILHIIARDTKSNKMMELPDIKYTT